MATYINVTVGGDDLLSKVKGQQQAGRFAFEEQQRLKELEAEKTKQEQDKRDQGRKLDPTPFKREQIAHRHPGDLTPLAVSWRGTWDRTQPHVVTNNQLGRVPTDPPWEFTYNGTGILTPNPIRFATTVNLSSVTQRVRSSIGTVDIISNVSGVTWPSQRFLNYWVTEVQHGESMIDPWVQVEALPTLSADIGPSTFSPSAATIAVSTTGVVFIVVELPQQPRPFTSMTSAAWLAAGSPSDVVVTDDRRQKTVLNGYPPWAMRGATYKSDSTQIPKPYLFLRIERGNVTELQADRAVGESYGDFYRAYCFNDDPSAPVRGTYDGYFQLNGQTATILRLNASGVYSDFPFGGMRQFVRTGADIPTVPSTARFELHRYNLPTWATDADLAALLTDCVPPGATGTNPATAKKVHCQASLYKKAKDRLGTDSGDVLTDNFYMVYPL